MTFKGQISTEIPSQFYHFRFITNFSTIPEEDKSEEETILVKYQRKRLKAKSVFYYYSYFTKYVLDVLHLYQLYHAFIFSFIPSINRFIPFLRSQGEEV